MTQVINKYIDDSEPLLKVEVWRRHARRPVAVLSVKVPEPFSS
jgi:hypothetical protein